MHRPCFTGRERASLEETEMSECPGPCFTGRERASLEETEMSECPGLVSQSEKGQV